MMMVICRRIADNNRYGSDRPRTLTDVCETFPRLKECEANIGVNRSGGEQKKIVIGRQIWNCLQILKHAGLSMLIIDKNRAP